MATGSKKLAKAFWSGFKKTVLLGMIALPVYGVFSGFAKRQAGNDERRKELEEELAQSSQMKNGINTGISGKGVFTDLGIDVDGPLKKGRWAGTTGPNIGNTGSRVANGAGSKRAQPNDKSWTMRVSNGGVDVAVEGKDNKKNPVPTYNTDKKPVQKTTSKTISKSGTQVTFKEESVPVYNTDKKTSEKPVPSVTYKKNTGRG